MTVWCSGRGGLYAAGGLGFESRRPRSCEIYAKKAGDGWALTGGGLHQLKKIHFFWVKIPIFSGFFRFQLCRVSGTRQRLCRVSIFGTRQRNFCRQSLCREAFAECLPGFAECPQHSAKRASAVVFPCKLQTNLCCCV